MDGRRFLTHHGVTVEKAQRFPAESFGKGLVGFRFGEGASDTHDRDTEDEAPAKGETVTAARKPARTGKRKAATATA